VADEVVFVDGGVVVESGAPAEVLGNPSHARTGAFLENVSSGTHSRDGAPSVRS
jgi:polar amino acid transport system ATP-binding protein